MPGLTRRRSPIKTQSLKEFMGIVSENQGLAVLVAPYVITQTRNCGAKDVSRMVSFTATIPATCQTVTYNQRLNNTAADEQGMVIRHLLLAEHEAKKLQAKLLNVAVKLVGLDGGPLDKQRRALLHQEAINRGITM